MFIICDLKVVSYLLFFYHSGKKLAEHSWVDVKKISLLKPFLKLYSQNKIHYFLGLSHFMRTM